MQERVGDVPTYYLPCHTGVGGRAEDAYVHTLLSYHPPPSSVSVQEWEGKRRELTLTLTLTLLGLHWAKP